MEYIKRQMEEVERSISTLCKLHKADRIFVLTDTGVAPLITGFLKGAPVLVVESGEGSKTLAGAERVWRFLEEEGAVRRSVLVNVGGGMVTDLGGFAAATFKRGIGCINVPTTLLGAIDAAIGGKTGINFVGLKNEIGVFSLPIGVFPLTGLFRYLPEEEWLSGVGEALKTALLDSEELLDLVSSDAFIKEREQEVTDEVVSRCAAYKESIVSADFREGGRRKVLNLGHTMGHAIEAWSMARGEAIPHGIAVAHGLCFALRRSVEKVGLSPETAERYEKIIEKYFPPLKMDGHDIREAEAYTARDKKNNEVGRPAWVLLEGIGRPRWDTDM